jgi:predicted transcriptional regulator
MFYIYNSDCGLQKGTIEWERSFKKNLFETPENTKLFSGLPSIAEPPAIGAYRNMMDRESLVEPLVHISQIMSSPVSTIGKDISLYAAWRQLQNDGIRQLVVTTKSKHVLGVLSDREILKYMNIINDEVETDRVIPVVDVLQTTTVTTDADSDIRKVARIMASLHIDAMPVVEQDRLVGIVTRGDILRGFAEHPKLNLWA